MKSSTWRSTWRITWRRPSRVRGGVSNICRTIFYKVDMVSDASKHCVSLSTESVIDSPASPFSAVGVQSHDFSFDNLQRGWDHFAREATEVRFVSLRTLGSLLNECFESASLAQFGDGIIRGPGRIIDSGAVWSATSTLLQKNLPSVCLFA